MQNFKYWKLVRSRWSVLDFYIWLIIWILLTLVSYGLSTPAAISAATGAVIVLTWYQTLGLWAAMSLVRVLILVFIEFLVSSTMCFLVYLGCKDRNYRCMSLYHSSIRRLEKRKK